MMTQNDKRIYIFAKFSTFFGEIWNKIKTCVHIISKFKFLLWNIFLISFNHFEILNDFFNKFLNFVFYLTIFSGSAFFGGEKSVG